MSQKSCRKEIRDAGSARCAASLRDLETIEKFLNQVNSSAEIEGEENKVKGFEFGLSPKSIATLQKILAPEYFATLDWETAKQIILCDRSEILNSEKHSPAPDI